MAHKQRLTTPVPARAILSVLFGMPPFVILSKNSRSKGILSSFCGKIHNVPHNQLNNRALHDYRKTQIKASDKIVGIASLPLVSSFPSAN